MKAKIAIVGSNGYIGKHLMQEFVQGGINDLVLTDIHRDSFFNDVNYLQWDITNSEERIGPVLKDCEYVFFLGGLTGTINSITNYHNYISINEIGLLNLLDLLKKYNPNCKVIFPSTRLVYRGRKGLPLKEDDEKEFRTIYAMNKFSCENYLKIFFDCYSIRYTVFRICVPYGNMTDDNLSYGTISHFLTKAKEKQNIVMFGDGLQRRTFTHISDLIKIMVTAAFNKQTDNEVFNIGGPDHLSILEAAEKIADLFSVSIEFKDWTNLDRSVESGDTIFDSTKLETIVPYSYKHSFDSWIKNYR